ncbi:M3 family metallopeptidase [Fluviispira vulneris]|uniref:M3 family metallopeptidase n=1 Tax=Fluviispira vulneris TaxID=2763012 RepID=UPI0016485777|nr:M3 family metallopeptidase [Fluviispira vulneris]
MSQFYILPNKTKRVYLSENFDPLNKNDVKEVIAKLNADIPNSFKSAGDWYGLFHEASCAISEAQTILELDLYFDTKNTEAEAKLNDFEENILSPLLIARSDLMDIYMSSPWRNAMHTYDNGRIFTDFKIRRKFTNQKISLLQIEENQHIREYKKFVNAAKTKFDDRILPISVVVGKLNDNDPKIRKSAFFSYWNFVKDNENFYQDNFSALLENRTKQAQSVQAKNYIEVAFSELGRIDYGEKECKELRDSIHRASLPLIEKLAFGQKESLQTNSIKPWDISIYPKLMPEKKPVNGDLEKLVLSMQNITSKIHPSFGKLFHEMKANNLIDISPRANKAAGAFCVTFQESKVPFIFANFSGHFRDAITFVHEFGHALHGYAVSNINNILLRHPGFEFCEVASIGLELLASPFFTAWWNNKSDAKKALAFQLFHMLHFWPFMAMMDEWQHVIYSGKETGDAKQRNKAWQNISKKYRPQVDWSGCEEFEELGWMSRPHIFTSPFYYIDYGIAQVGALQLWKQSRENYQQAVHNYISGLSLGAQCSLQDLFTATGLSFDFSEKMIKDLCSEIEKVIEDVS